MPKFSLFTKARISMFEHTPPVFYYGQCLQTKDPRYILPSFIKNRYQDLLSAHKPSCLYILSTKIGTITQDQWKSAHTLGYSL